MGSDPDGLKNVTSAPPHDAVSTTLRACLQISSIVSAPEIYTHEWATFSTRAYPENRTAQCGEVVRIVTTDYSDARPVEDIVWPHQDYVRVYREAGLEIVRVERPLASGDEGIAWKSETRVSPWAIYLLRKAAA